MCLRETESPAITHCPTSLVRSEKKWGPKCGERVSAIIHWSKLGLSLRRHENQIGHVILLEIPYHKKKLIGIFGLWKVHLSNYWIGVVEFMDTDSVGTY